MLRLTELRRDSLPASHVIAIDDSTQLTWGDFLADIDEFSAMLAYAEISSCALYETDTYRFAVALFALLAKNCSVYLPGNNHQSEVEALREHVDTFIGDFPSSALLDSGNQNTGMQANEIELQGEIIVFTSGSTGNPTAISKRLEQLDNEIEVLEDCFGELLGRCNVFSTVSHQHLYGLTFHLLWPLCAERPFWRRAFLDPVLLARCASRFNPSCWIMSPAHLHRLSPEIPWQSLRNSVTTVFSSGGPLLAHSAREVEKELGALPWEVLGSSETGAIARRQHHGRALWQALPKVELGLTEAGCLKVRSPFLADSDWYATNDQAQFDTAGGFELGGRSDRILKIEGKRVSLPKVELAIGAHPWIGEAHALDITRKRQVIAAVITLTGQGEAALIKRGQTKFNRELRASLTSRLPALALPRSWRILAHLPRNNQGKLQRATMENLFSGPRLPPIVSETIEAGSADLRIWVDPSLPYFEGHFSQGAVVPGVVLIMWAELLARIALGLEGDFSGMQKVKFKEIVRPNTLLSLSLVLEPSRQRLQYRFTSEKVEHSQGYLQYMEH